MGPEEPGCIFDPYDDVDDVDDVDEDDVDEDDGPCPDCELYHPASVPCDWGIA